MKIKIRKFPNSKINEFGRWITTFDWSEQFKIADPNDKDSYFQAITWHMVEKCFPLTTVKLSSNDKEWMTPHIKSLIRQRQKAHLNNRVNQTDELAEKVKVAIKEAKRKFKKDKVGVLNKKDTREWFQKVNKIVNSGKNKQLNLLNIVEVAHKSKNEITSIINENFANICRRYPSLENNTTIPEKHGDKDIEMTDELGVYKLIKKFAKKYTGPGQIPQKLFDEFAPEFATPISDITNCSLRNRIFPEAYKKAEIIPIPKCNPPNELTDLRPISMTPIIGKIIETKIMEELDKDTKGKLDNEQYGNTKGNSTTHYLVKLTNEAYRSTDVGNATTAITIDYSKAFDYVDHNILIQKLIKLGVRGSIINLII